MLMYSNPKNLVNIKNGILLFWVKFVVTIQNFNLDDIFQTVVRTFIETKLKNIHNKKYILNLLKEFS